MSKSPSSGVLQTSLFVLAAWLLLLGLGPPARADTSLPPLRMPNQPVGSRCFGLLPCTTIDSFGIRLRAAALAIFRPEKGRDRELYAARIQISPSVTLFEWGEIGIAIPITLYTKDIGVTPIYEPLQPFARVRLPLDAFLRGLATAAFVRIHIAHGPFVGGLPPAQAANAGMPAMPDFMAQAMQNYQAQTQLEFGVAMQKRIGPMTATGSVGTSVATQRVEIYGGVELVYNFKIFNVFVQGQGVGVPKCPPEEAALNFCARGFRFGAGVRFDFDIGQGGIMIGTGSGAVEPGWMVGAQLGLDYDEKVRRMHGDGVDAAHAWWDRRFEAIARGWAAWKSAAVAWDDEDEAARRALPPRRGPFSDLLPSGVLPESSPWLDGLLGEAPSSEPSPRPGLPGPVSQVQQATAKPSPGRKPPRRTLFAAANARAAAKRQLEQLPQFKLPGSLDLMTDEELAREQWRVFQEDLRRAEQQQWRDSPDLPPNSKALLNGLARIPFNMLSPFLMGSPQGAAQVAEMWDRLRPVKYTPEEKKYGETMEEIVGFAGELAATVGGGALLDLEKAGSQIALRAGAREAAKQVGREAAYQAAEQAALSAGEGASAEIAELGGSRISQLLAAARARLNPANYRVCGVSSCGGGIEFKPPKLPADAGQVVEHEVPAVVPKSNPTAGEMPAAIRQIDDFASAATPAGRRGQQASFPNPRAPRPRNAPGTVDGREFSGHAFDRMQERGFTPTVIENAIHEGRAAPGASPGTIEYFDPGNNLKVITDAATGRVITVY